MTKENDGGKNDDGPYVADTIHEAGNILATNTHKRAVNQVTIVSELQLADHYAFL
jgi:hypothetical protein